MTININLLKFMSPLSSTTTRRLYFFRVYTAELKKEM